ncbi:MAG: GIY-YIG nuclease family protein [Sphingobacteriales bacterium]|nr:MAG: GIY-YIG nuclease family protein [Sphingobacteriales bacterium]
MHLMHFVYILYSPSFNRYYIGETENPDRRLEQHRNHSFPGASTRIASDWELQTCLKTKNRMEARQLEAFLKKMKSKTFLEKLVNDAICREGFIRDVGKRLNITLDD